MPLISSREEETPYNRALNEALDAISLSRLPPFCISLTQQTNPMPTLNNILRYTTYLKNLDNWNEQTANHFNRFVQARNTKRTTLSIIKLFEKRFNFKLILMLRAGNYSSDHYLYPKSLAKSCHFSDKFYWLISQQFEKSKAQNHIKWCSVNKEWCWYTTFKTYYKIDKSGTIISITQAQIMGNRLDLKQCPNCHLDWEPKTIFKLHQQTENLCCPKCYSISLSNLINSNDETQIKEYHSHSNWKFLIQRITTSKKEIDKKDQDTLPMGLEIEVHAKKNLKQAAALAIYLTQFEFNKAWNNLYFEQDRSLNGGGFEIITNPMTLRYHQEYWKAMLPILRKYTHGWDADKYGSQKQYGIHITCHNKYWPDKYIARLGRFWNNPENKKFLWAIAQRAIAYGVSNADGIASYDKKLSSIFKIKNKKLEGHSHFDLINLTKKPLIELRMFRTTLHQESFLKNLEFVDSFRKWCMETPYRINYEVYLQWLNKNSTHKEMYPNLLGYLNRDSFACKQTEKFSNPFKSLMVSPDLPIFGSSVVVVNEPSDLEDAQDLLTPTQYKVVTNVPDNPNPEHQAII